MHLTLYTVVGLLLAWLGYLVYQWWSAKAALQGREIGNLVPQLADHPEHALVYCFSPGCGPCRRMSPLIDRLCEQRQPIVKLDVSEQAELANRLQIRAVPTLLVVRCGVVEQVLLGIQPEEEIEALLNG